MPKSASPKTSEEKPPPPLGTDRALRIGTGRATGHHGELLQGVFEGPDGCLHRGLITLPMAREVSVATFWPSPDGTISTRPEYRTKAARAAKLTLTHLGLTQAGGELTIESSMPVGHGYGSSTADVVAAIRAVADAADRPLRSDTICRLASEAEGASDAIAYENQTVLFAQREGRAIEHLGGELPPLVVIGIRALCAPIDTLTLPPARYSTFEIEMFRALRGAARRAVLYQDPHLLGKLASCSAWISQRHLPKPQFHEFVQLAEAHGACGVQVSHSGTLIGAVFDATQSGLEAEILPFKDAVQEAGMQKITAFAVNAELDFLP